jgi:hypothetical protein
MQKQLDLAVGPRSDGTRRPPAAWAIRRTRSASRPVCRAWVRATGVICPTKVCRPHTGLRQRQRIASRCNSTGVPCTGRSWRSRTWLLRRRFASTPQSGHFAEPLASAVTIHLSIRNSALTTRMRGRVSIAGVLASDSRLQIMRFGKPSTEHVNQIATDPSIGPQMAVLTFSCNMTPVVIVLNTA